MRRLVACVVVTLLGLAFVLTAPVPAWAHNELVSAMPPDGAALDRAPREVRLVFAEPVNPRLTQVAVTDGQGQRIAVPAATSNGVQVVQPLTLPGPGRYAVSYRVVSRDGHPVGGVVRFTVSTAPTAALSAPAATTTAAAPGSRPASGTAPSTAGRSWWWTLAVAGALGLVSLVALVRRRRHPGDDR